MTDCKFCSNEKSGYSAKCIDCCARLIKSARCSNPNGRHIASRQQKMLFEAIAMFPGACKRDDIIDRIKSQET